MAINERDQKQARPFPPLEKEVYRLTTSSQQEQHLLDTSDILPMFGKEEGAMAGTAAAVPAFFFLNVH